MYWLHLSTPLSRKWRLGQPGDLLFITGRDMETGCHRIALSELGHGCIRRSAVKVLGPPGREPGHVAAWEAFREMIEEEIMHYTLEF